MQEVRCPPLDRAWTAEEGAAMVAEWRRSGKSASAFVRARGFGLHRLRYWSSRTDEIGSNQADFVVVPFGAAAQADEDGAEDATEDDDGPMIEVCVRDEIFVRIPMKADRLLIADALKAVLEVGR